MLYPTDIAQQSKRAQIPVHNMDLHKIIKEKSFVEKEVTLSLGQTSTYYFDMKPTMLDAEGAYLIAYAVLQKLPPTTNAVGGLEMGAVPIIGALCPIIHIEKKSIDCFFVRKTAKPHGMQKRIEGVDNLSQKNVVIIEDVTTTGHSALQAVQAVHNAGGIVTNAISIVDREEGASTLFAQHKIGFDSLFKASAFKA